MRTKTMLAIALAAVLGVCVPALAPACAVAQEDDPGAVADTNESHASTELWIRGPRPAGGNTPSEDDKDDPAPKPGDGGKTDDPDDPHRDFPTTGEPSPKDSTGTWETTRSALARTADMTRRGVVVALFCFGAALVLLSRAGTGKKNEEVCDA